MLTSRILQRQGTKIHTTKSNKGQVGYVYLYELQQKDNTYKTGEAVSREEILPYLLFPLKEIPVCFSTGKVVISSQSKQIAESLIELLR